MFGIPNVFLFFLASQPPVVVPPGKTSGNFGDRKHNIAVPDGKPVPRWDK